MSDNLQFVVTFEQASLNVDKLKFVGHSVYRFESATGVEEARAGNGSGVKSSPGLIN